MSAFKGGKERWIVTEDIPGIAMKDELIVVDHRGILVGRWLPLSKYDVLMASRHLRPLGGLTASFPYPFDTSRPRDWKALDWPLA